MTSANVGRYNAMGGGAHLKFWSPLEPQLRGWGELNQKDARIGARGEGWELLKILLCGKGLVSTVNVANGCQLAGQGGKTECFKDSGSSTKIANMVLIKQHSE